MHVLVEQNLIEGKMTMTMTNKCGLFGLDHSSGNRPCRNHEQKASTGIVICDRDTNVHRKRGNLQWIKNEDQRRSCEKSNAKAKTLPLKN